jgi:hypothetical protein
MDTSVPPGDWIAVRTIQETLSPQGVRSQPGSWIISGKVTEEFPPLMGSNYSTPGFAITRNNGWYYLLDAITPATWEWTYHNGPCRGRSDSELFNNRTEWIFLCQVTVSSAFQYGYLTDGTPVFTGGNDKLVVGQNAVMFPNQSRTSADGRFRLTYQDDGNLVLRDENGSPIWAINCWPECTDMGTAGRAEMQSDGNFVVYNGDGVAVWATATNGNNNSFAVVQSDGNTRLYRNPNGTYTWETGTGGH